MREKSRTTRTSVRRTYQYYKLKLNNMIFQYYKDEEFICLNRPISNTTEPISMKGQSMDT